MEKLPFTEIKKGSFLIATPDIAEGIFSRSVILLCEHTSSGSFGLVVNKKLDIDLPNDVLSPTDIINPRVGIRAGGPVQATQMMLLHTNQSIPTQTLEICSGVYLGGDLQFLQETVTNQAGSEIRLCFGYSGWGVGQLEREYLDGQWFISQANAETIFDTKSRDIWRQSLIAMGGRYASYAMIPEDLTLN